MSSQSPVTVAPNRPRIRSPRRYTPFMQPTLSMSELVRTTLDHDNTDMLIDRWLEHRSASVLTAANPDGGDTYEEWFRTRKCSPNRTCQGQQLLWTKGAFLPENIFCRTVDTGRLIPLDRTWKTHVYHHKSMKLSMMHVVFTMLPELMLLRGMHDTNCDEIYIIVTDLKRKEMDDAINYFKFVSRHLTRKKQLKGSVESRIWGDHTRLTTLRLTPCFPQIDLTFRALLYEKKPPFIILFSHSPASYSQILFTSKKFVPSKEVFWDWPTGCLNPDCCDRGCEMVRWPRGGASSAVVLKPKKKKKILQMCNWIECQDSSATQVCSKCRLVKYCSSTCQKRDWDEHRRVCVPMTE